MNIAMFPHSREAGAARQARGHIVTEYHEFAAAVQSFEHKLRWAASLALIEARCEDKKITADDCIHDMLWAVFGDRWADIKRRFDDEGGRVDLMPWPISKPDPKEAA